MTAWNGRGPLAGLRVLELTRGRAGALAGMLLCDYGAEVLRIEPPGGDPLWDRLPGYRVWHRGKEIVEIDLSEPAGPQAVAARLALADVFLDGMAPRTLRRFGLGFDDVRLRAPRLVYTSIRGFGDEAEDERTPGYEALVQARLGIPSYQGARHGRPTPCTYPAASYGAGVVAVIGTLAALHQRERSGLGQHVETSLVDGVLAQMTMALVAPPGEAAPPPVSGVAPTLTIYRCGDHRHLQIHLGARGALDRILEATGLRREEFIHEHTGRHFAGDPEAGERFRRALTAALATGSRDEWVARLTAAGVPVAPCLAPGEALEHPQTRALSMMVEMRDPLLGPIRTIGAPIRFSGSPAGVPQAARQRGMPANPEAALRHSGWLTEEEVPTDASRTPEATGGTASEAPLAGLRVLDFGMFAAGPYAAMLLGELGADVVKIEPPTGDTMRPNARPFSGLHRGKRGLALDLKSPHATRVVQRLVDRADVVLHNFRPGVAERLGLGWDALSARRPDLVHFHSTGYGTDGPMASLPGFDQIYQAFCGMATAQGGDGNPPEQVAGAPLDCLNALLSAAGILMALRHRARTGQGQHAECAQLAAGLFACSEVYRAGDEWTHAGRLDAERLSLGPGYGIEPARDGWVFVCCADDAARERWQTVRERELDAQRSVAEWLEALARAGVPAGRVRVPFDATLFDDPLVLATDRVAEVVDPALGRVRQPARFLRFSGATLPAPRGGPALGQHSREILREVGLDDPEVADLIASGVVSG